MGARTHFEGELPSSWLVPTDEKQFGGDPNHVVVHGVSAGGGSVAMHLTAQ